MTRECNIEKMKNHYAKYIKLMRRSTGCLVFCKRKNRREDVEVLKYFLETSNWFLFDGEGTVLKLINLEKG